MKAAFNFDNTYVNLPDNFFARVEPVPVSMSAGVAKTELATPPQWIAFNHDLAKQLGLDGRALSSDQGLDIFTGNIVPEGAEPLAMAYAGQQFGHFVPQLGDGRAVLLGEVLDLQGNRFDVQLKGSGRTPFSRGGDGRAWLGPVMREYIVSEAMAALGVPTTRALAAVTTGEKVMREQVLPGAILTRIARSHGRVGTFQYFAARGERDALTALADYLIHRLYPHVADDPNPYLGLLQEVIAAQAQLVAKWLNCGFVHGVMNTDNVSIAGETIDYGPCAFMEEFSAERVFSSIDEQGRYAYGNQPRIAHWNMVQLAQALLPLLADNEQEAVAAAQRAVDAFGGLHKSAYQKQLNLKLGLQEVQKGDDALGQELLQIMSAQKADFTLTFWHLAEALEGGKLPNFFAASNFSSSVWEGWLQQWKARREKQKLNKAQCKALMEKANPAFIPRNHRIEQAIFAALEGDYAPFERLTRVLKKPFDVQSDDLDLMAAAAPDERVHYTFCGT